MGRREQDNRSDSQKQNQDRLQVSVSVAEAACRVWKDIGLQNTKLLLRGETDRWSNKQKVKEKKSVSGNDAAL